MAISNKDRKYFAAHGIWRLDDMKRFKNLRDAFDRWHEALANGDVEIEDNGQLWYWDRGRYNRYKAKRNGYAILEKKLKALAADLTNKYPGLEIHFQSDPRGYSLTPEMKNSAMGGVKAGGKSWTEQKAEDYEDAIYQAELLVKELKNNKARSINDNYLDWYGGGFSRLVGQAEFVKKLIQKAGGMRVRFK